VFIRPRSVCGVLGEGEDMELGPSSVVPSLKGSFASESPLVLIACGALAGHIREIVNRRGWQVELRCLPGLLHNRPKNIAPQVERLALSALSNGKRVAVAYSDCGTYSAVDEVCARLKISRLPGLHCYDVFAGEGTIRALFEAEPGTYLLTDYLIRIFEHTVIPELGLDRYPELWPDYFRHYRRVVWLAQERHPTLDAEAERIAGMFGLPLTIVETGTRKLERALEQLINERASDAN
jgi:Protein of unknown function (DUF1638)